jgi:hypothetical protein
MNTEPTEITINFADLSFWQRIYARIRLAWFVLWTPIKTVQRIEHERE